MTDEQPKKKRNRNRQNEYARAKLKRAEEAAKRAAEDKANTSEGDIEEQLAVLAARTAGEMTDADRDIDFAYKNSANPTITPLMAPSLGAWRWYEYAQALPEKFLEICAKREDAKAKAAGQINTQRMEDDKRQQFAVIDRIIRQLEVDVDAIARDLMQKCPEDLLNSCRKHRKAWDAYFAKFPLDAVE
jgi:hypothetical protein